MSTKLPDNFDPPPMKSSHGLTCCAISMIGPKEGGYTINSTDGKLGFVCNRGFSNSKDALTYYKTAIATRKVISMMLVQLHTPLCLTLESKNLSDAKYQENKIVEILTPLFEEVSTTSVLTKNDETDKDIPPPLEGEVDAYKPIDVSKLPSSFHIEALTKPLPGKDKADDSHKTFFSPEEISNNTTAPMNNAASTATTATASEAKKEEKSKVIEVSELFVETQKFSKLQKFCLVQFISHNQHGQPLPEPIIIIRGFFKSEKVARQYKDEFYDKSRIYAENHPSSILDMVVVPLNQPVTAWYSRKNVEKIEEHRDEKKKRELENKKTYDPANLSKDLAPFLMKKNGKSSIIDRINNFEDKHEDQEMIDRAVNGEKSSIETINVPKDKEKEENVNIDNNVNTGADSNVAEKI